MLELVGAEEEKEVKVKVQMSTASDGDINIYYDDIYVAWIDNRDGEITSVWLPENTRDMLIDKGILIENECVKLSP